MPRAHTTTSCRAFALITLFVACAGPVRAGDRPPAPKLPLAQWWSVPLEGQVSAGPVSSGSRIYLAYASGSLVARDSADGHELWRVDKSVTLPMAVDGDLLVTSSGDAIEALHGDSGASAWIVPRTKTAAPLVAHAGLVIAVTDTDVVAIRAATGEIVWHRAAGGVRLAPVLDGERVYAGAEDGRLLALDLSDGRVVWEQFFTGGTTALGAYRGRAYVGSGEKRVVCVDAQKNGRLQWSYPIGAQAIGRIAVDDERVYVAALDNVVRAFDRQNGNQRWQAGIRQRPVFGVRASGHIVFVPAASSDVQMLWDRNGVRSGSLGLPGEAPTALAPAILDSPAGPIVYTVTGGLTNEWNLTKFAPAGEAALIPFATLETAPGLPFLTDPELKPIGNVLKQLIIGDPPLKPASEIDWPVVLTDPPLVPLTTVPGLQLRPLSPVLPARRGGSATGG